MNTLAMNGVDLGHINDGGDVFVLILVIVVGLLASVIFTFITGSLSAGLFSGGLAAGAVGLSGMLIVSSTMGSGQQTAVSDMESHYDVKLMSSEKNGDMRAFDSSDTVFDQDNEYKRVAFEDNEGLLHEGYIVFVEERARNSKVFALAVDTSEEGRDLVEYDEDADVEAEQNSEEALEEVEAND